MIKPACFQNIVTAQIILSNPGTQYIPVNAHAQLISTNITDSFKTCTTLCINNVMCRVYDYEASGPKACRLFEGDTNTFGEIGPSSSSSPQSYTATIHLSPDLFIEYGLPCSSICHQSRYLQCGNSFTCECVPHTYWDPLVSMCVVKSPLLGSSCRQNLTACREDLNFTCLQFNQCGPVSVLSAITVMNASTPVNGSSTAGVSQLGGLYVFETNTVSIVIADTTHNRILLLIDDGITYRNASVIATEWAPGRPLYYPVHAYVDVRNEYNLYVSDLGSNSIILYKNMQTVNPPPIVIAGNASSYLSRSSRIYVDSRQNVFVSSTFNHSILFFPQNATSGTIVVGQGVASSSSRGLNKPAGLVLDEYNGWLYIADSNNHRIQRYSINDTWPCNGTTVAGGNGYGHGSNQLAFPYDIWFSKKYGAIYIVDAGNNRIQRWQPGAKNGVTIAGDPNGGSGTDAIRLNNPSSIAINENETLMYVGDMDNRRIQRFRLI